nr:DsbA family protein [Legionella israelensis]
MNIKYLLAAGALASVLTSPTVTAADAMSDAQKKQIEKIVHDYLVNHPEVLLEASQALQQKQQQTLQEEAKSAIQQNASQLFSDSMAVLGNPKGNVTLVEFFDYQCIHCKKMAPVVSELLKKDNNLRVIYKEFPIFGKSSELASRAALAASMQGKYKEMHNALLKLDKRLNEQLIMDTAKSLGLNIEKLKKDMDSTKVTDELKENRELAEKLRLMGTPAFIIASTPSGKYKEGADTSFIPGAASEETLQELIEKAAGDQS